jgi:hypothetical protein
MGGDEDSSYYYRNDKDYYLKAEDDYLYCPQVYSPNRGGWSTPEWTPGSGKVLNYYPRRFAKFNPGPFVTEREGIHGIKRFLHVLVGDIVKIYCKWTYVISSDGFDHFEYGIFEGYYEQPSFGNFTRFAKEIIIGDGFRGQFGAGLKVDYTKKVFVGKNIEKVWTHPQSVGRRWQSGCHFAQNHSKCRMYIRKETTFEDRYDHNKGKIIRI